MEQNLNVEVELEQAKAEIAALVKRVQEQERLAEQAKHLPKRMSVPTFVSIIKLTSKTGKPFFKGTLEYPSGKDAKTGRTVYVRYSQVLADSEDAVRASLRQEAEALIERIDAATCRDFSKPRDAAAAAAGQPAGDSGEPEISV